MKFFLVLASLLLSLNLFAGDFDATVIKDQNVLSINLNDSFIPPFESGEMWKIMRGTDRRKYIDTEDFSMECDGLSDSSGEIYGACSIMISMDKLQKIEGKLIYKLTGSSAAKLNRYFTDSAYVSIQRGKVYLSSYNTRRQFFFGIDEDLIKK
ncbi:MAG: hypothetical protein K2Q18_17455 [Bdellovibrionales bacterium]|nr:hypothetical protein [Bdellovibrionales bacterium]